MLVGYARTSTIDQEAGFEAQKRELGAIGCERIFAEQASSVGARPELADALSFIRAGDTLVVTKLDRLARSVLDLMEILQTIQKRGAELRILSMGLDTSSPTGRLMLGVLGSVAQFEREIMLERQREGIAKAKADGRYKGRAPTARRMSNAVHELKGHGKGPAAIARELGISRSSVYRILESNGVP